MHILFDFLPILLFFITFKVTSNLVMATIVAMVVGLLQLLGFRYRRGYFNKTHIISFASILILGGATILLHDEIFIKWKPTAVYWLLALVLLVSQYLGKKPVIKRLMEGNITLPEKIWQRLNLSWCLFCIAMGIVNLYVVYNFDTATWVNFKLFGTLGLTMLFIIVQGVLLSKFVAATGSANGNE